MTGAAVAAVMERPQEVVRPDRAPVPVRAIYEPESWIDVYENDEAPEPLVPVAALRAEAAAAHPETALLVVYLDGRQEFSTSALVGLPPGSHQVLASCHLTEVPEEIAPPVEFSPSVGLVQRVQPEAADLLPCDGTARLVPPVTGRDFGAYELRAWLTWSYRPEVLRDWEEHGLLGHHEGPPFEWTVAVSLTPDS